ncbi:transposable element Tcb2 transposase [Trichonephila clavipes]|nr:transposable element Tcb2 transposase [Trichonephila clavipes]
MSFTGRPGAGSPRQISRQGDRHIVRNARVQPTASSAAIQVQVAHSLGTPVSFRTIRRCLAKGHLGSRANYTAVLDDHPSTHAFQVEPHTRKLDCSGIEPDPPHCESLNFAFALQRRSAPTAGVIAWVNITYNTRSPLVLIRGTITAELYVHDILQTHLLLVIQRLPGAIFQQDNAWAHIARLSQDCIRTVTTIRWTARSSDLSPIEHIWDHLGRRVSASHELE